MVTIVACTLAMFAALAAMSFCACCQVSAVSPATPSRRQLRLSHTVIAELVYKHVKADTHKKSRQ
jgi:hypothetical protein